MFEMFQLPFMLQAFAAAAITGILLSYLGVHVVGYGDDFHSSYFYIGRRITDVIH